MNIKIYSGILLTVFALGTSLQAKVEISAQHGVQPLFHDVLAKAVDYAGAQGLDAKGLASKLEIEVAPVLNQCEDQLQKAKQVCVKAVQEEVDQATLNPEKWIKDKAADYAGYKKLFNRAWWLGSTYFQVKEFLSNPVMQKILLVSSAGGSIWLTYILADIYSFRFYD